MTYTPPARDHSAIKPKRPAMPKMPHTAAHVPGLPPFQARLHRRVMRSIRDERAEREQAREQ